MGKLTNIAWCDSTFNSWIGCTRVGPGCDHCYAEQQDARKRWGGVAHWGAGIPRYRTSASNWKQPLLWNRYAKHGFLPDGKTLSGGRNPRVFCASLADVFDNEVPPEWRADLMKLIVDTPRLSWLLVTKRIGNVERMIEEAGDLIDYGEGWQSMWGQGAWPENVRLLITVCNQEEAYRDIPKLFALPCKNGISYEPALGPVDWSPWLIECNGCDREGASGGGTVLPLEYHTHGRRTLEWIIVGGESGQRARPFDLNSAHSTIKQCKAAEIACFVKQLGSNPVNGAGFRYEWVKHRAGADPSEWPEDLRVREYPQ